MDKKVRYMLGTVFIIAAGLIYTFERFIAYFAWIGEMNANLGSFSTYPDIPGVFTNIFVPIFIGIGVLFWVSTRKDKNKELF